MGGGFGGKSAERQAHRGGDAREGDRQAGQVCWTREEEFFLDTFRPAAVVKIRSGLDDEGRISFWDYQV